MNKWLWRWAKGPIECKGILHVQKQITGKTGYKIGGEDWRWEKIPTDINIREKVNKQSRRGEKSQQKLKMHKTQEKYVRPRDMGKSSRDINRIKIQGSIQNEKIANNKKILSTIKIKNER